MASLDQRPPFQHRIPRTETRPPIDVELPAEVSRILDLSTLTVKVEQLTDLQRQHAHLIAPDFFPGGVNPFRADKTKADYVYETPIALQAELFYLHLLMDPMVLEQGNVRRFPAGVNEKYITEKYEDDTWVSEGNHALSLAIEEHLRAHLEQFQAQPEIHLLDIGPCGGSITTLFALRAFARTGLLEQVRIVMLDIVPNVLEATLLGKFDIPQAMIDEYGLEYAGAKGEAYKNLLAQGVLHGVDQWYAQPGHEKNSMTDAAVAHSQAMHDAGTTRVQYYGGDGEELPADLPPFDVIMAGYVHHHMNMRGRQKLMHQMEQAAKPGTLIGVVDFCVSGYNEYMQWCKPHFEAHGDAPPVECPVVNGKILKTFLKETAITREDTGLEKSFLLSGVKNN